MRQLWSALLFTCLSSTAFAEAKREFSPYGTAMAGDGVQLQIVDLTEKDAAGNKQVLVKLSGKEADEQKLDGKILKAFVEDLGQKGFNVKTKINGDDWVLITSRAIWGIWTTMDLYLGNKTIPISKDEKASKKMDVKGIYNAFKK